MISLTNIIYLIAAILFILGLKNLGSPKTARRGNLMAMSAMLIAVVITLFNQKILDFTHIIIGLIIGGTIGVIVAKKVQMTDMPQLVALFNGLGGAASSLVAISEFLQFTAEPLVNVSITIMLSVLIGTLTFSGSLIAFAKLQGLMRSAPIVFKMQQLLNALLFLTVIILGVVFVLDTGQWYLLLAIVGIAAFLGILAVIPIGGADMPVVISLLNSYSGIAASATGFVLSNNILIISGALVGASGIILTKIMCEAMNRSLTNVLFGAVGQADAAAAAERRDVTRYTPDDASMMLDNARSVIIVPGYGLAVAQAQHALSDLANILTSRGIDVKYAIHPVAGRMPGHMNVLLAEAHISYDLLNDMDEINDEFQNTDVALVIGANDVINPAARSNKASSLYGMPILNVDQTNTVMIVKRSLSPGFAGEDNELFYDQKTMMIFGDAKQMIVDIIRILKE